ncbi:hypothetical protein KUCAC02_034877, partial [Chaenocephalus aceratus]
MGSLVMNRNTVLLERRPSFGPAVTLSVRVGRDQRADHTAAERASSGGWLLLPQTECSPPLREEHPGCVSLRG